MILALILYAAMVGEEEDILGVFKKETVLPLDSVQIADLTYARVKLNFTLSPASMKGKVPSQVRMRLAVPKTIVSHWRVFFFDSLEIIDGKPNLMKSGPTTLDVDQEPNPLKRHAQLDRLKIGGTYRIIVVLDLRDRDTKEAAIRAIKSTKFTLSVFSK